MEQREIYELEKEQQLLQAEMSTLEKQIMILKENEWREKKNDVCFGTMISVFLLSACHLLLGRGVIPFSIWKTVACSIAIGFIGEKITSIVNHEKEKLRAFSMAKTEQEKIEEQMEKEIRLEKTKAKYVANQEVKQKLDRLENRKKKEEESVAALCQKSNEAERKFDKALEQYAIATRYYQLITKKKGFFNECLKHFLPLFLTVMTMASCVSASSTFLLVATGVSCILSPIGAALERMMHVHQEKKALQKRNEWLNEDQVKLGNEYEMVLEIYRLATQIGKTGKQEVSYQEAKANLLYQKEENKRRALFGLKKGEASTWVVSCSYDNPEKEVVPPYVKQLHR